MSIIRLQDMTPKPYYEQSRDFQFIGRLYDLVLNNMKLNADMVYSMPLSNNSDKQFLDLLTLTLGFKQRHNYNTKQLAAICSAFCEILKNKGNIKSLELAVNALLKAEGIKQEFHYTLEDENTRIILSVPATLSDINLLRDLLDYILPAGMNCDIIRATYITTKADTQLAAVPDVVDSKKVSSISTKRSELATNDFSWWSKIGTSIPAYDNTKTDYTLFSCVSYISGSTTEYYVGKTAYIPVGETGKAPNTNYWMLVNAPAAWDETTSYSKYTIVSYTSNYYVNKATLNEGVSPDTASDYAKAPITIGDTGLPGMLGSSLLFNE